MSSGVEMTRDLGDPAKGKVSWQQNIFFVFSGVFLCNSKSLLCVIKLSPTTKERNGLQEYFNHPLHQLTQCQWQGMQGQVILDVLQESYSACNPNMSVVEEKQGWNVLRNILCRIFQSSGI